MATTNDSSTTNSGSARKALESEAFHHACAAGVFNWLQIISEQIEKDATNPARVKQWASLASYLAETWGNNSEEFQQEAHAKAIRLTARGGAA